MPGVSLPRIGADSSVRARPAPRRNFPTVSFDGHLCPVELQGTLRLDIGTVPAVWIRLPAELEGERGQFDVEIRFGEDADVAGVKFENGTAWIPLPPALVNEAARAGKLAVFVQAPLGTVPEDLPYFTIDWPEP